MFNFYDCQQEYLIKYHDTLSKLHLIHIRGTQSKLHLIYISVGQSKPGTGQFSKYSGEKAKIIYGKLQQRVRQSEIGR